MDYPDVVKRKVKLIKSKPILSDLIDQNCLGSDESIESVDYKLFIADVRDIAYVTEKLSTVEKQRPTLILTECLLIYMKATDSELILNGFASLFPSVSFLNYEMIRPDDKFG
jgi:hypothetical protein